jgi:hypothetical protein
MMNEQDFLWILFWSFSALAGIGIVFMIIEEVTLKYYPHLHKSEASLSEALDELYEELQTQKEINVAEYLKERV